jgi:hypothetical protein
MKRSHIVLLTVVASSVFLAVVLSITAGHTDPTFAAPRPDHDARYPLNLAYQPLYQAIYCTLATTTTDNLEDSDNYTYTNAVALANYNGLALAAGDEDVTVPAEEDWFRRDNANEGSVYEVEAIPDKTSNYNLGIIVYDASLTEITRDTDPADNNRAQVELEAENEGPYYFRVYQLTPDCTGETYRLSISVTPPTPSEEDDYEDNDTRESAYVFPIAVSVAATDANFYPEPDEEDWYAFYVKDGRTYRATTSNLIGVDTYLEVFHRNGSRVENDNDGGGGFASEVEWEASYSDDYYYIRVTNRVDTSEASDTYDLTVSEVTVATSTPKPTKTGPTPIPGADQFEPNWDFDHAATIATDVTYQANFIPSAGGWEDNDFYKIWIKPGLHFTCETSELAPGVDTNIIVYDGNQNAIGGNDDVELGDYSSRLAYFSTYEGWLYVLIGHGGRLPGSELEDSNYKFRCDMDVPGQATATPIPQATTPAGTPPPGPPTATPIPPEALTVRALTTPTPVAATTPVPRFIPVSLLVYYDAQDDNMPGAGEGIAGISAQAYDVVTNQLLAQGFTDEQGHLEFTVSAQGPVRVSVPFFGFSQLVAGEGASIYLRVPPQPLSGGEP